MHTSSDSNLLKIKNLSFGYNNENLLNNLNVNVTSGEFIGILGPNGSGKSTLVKLMAGLLKPGTGSIELNGSKIHSFTAKERAREISYVPQFTHFAHAFKCMEIVLMGRYPHNSMISYECEKDLDIAREAMQMTGCSDFENRFFHELSGGERQRIVLAAAIAQAPKILLLDEPTAWLDLKFQIQIFQVLSQLNQMKKLTIFTVIHDINLAARFCHKIICLGSDIPFIGSIKEVMTEKVLSKMFGIEIVSYRNSDSEIALMPNYTEKPQ